MKEDWPGANSFMNYSKPSLTLKQLRVLREFYTAQQALAVELQEAKPLGICKTITSTKIGRTMNESFEEDSRETLLSAILQLHRRKV